jgi:hypothetical protein
LTKLGREVPEMPCAVWFGEAQWQALVVFVLVWKSGSVTLKVLLEGAVLLLKNEAYEKTGNEGTKHQKLDLESIRRTGWARVPFGTKASEFKKRFPKASLKANGMWDKGEGKEWIAGTEMTSACAFNRAGELYMIVFYPDMRDRELIAPLLAGVLGTPAGSGALWTQGSITLSVKTAGVAVVLVDHSLPADQSGRSGLNVSPVRKVRSVLKPAPAGAPKAPAGEAVKPKAPATACGGRPGQLQEPFTR